MSSAPSFSSELPAVLIPHVDSVQKQLLLRYAELLRRINASLNLISRKDIEWVWEHHIIPSLLFLGWWRLPAGAKVLDIGTGGGLPGIPLAITHPQTYFFLIDSTRKKVEALRFIVKELELSERVEVHWGRAEELPTRFPYIVGRAVAPLPRFLSWCQKVLSPQGTVFYYTGGDYGPLPPPWKGEFYAFAQLVPQDEYLSSKGILKAHLSPA
ncbi:MAG: 16S rRNA (guanine(527)-N(7))-methyltransferase RsmG [Bacteroidia bacterium]|nr:16S rRNA (guanine(527)-N(7))-methyltransferase RsmG [Bacteroidia bacterium]MCX7763983.1 16S rRNA (guanine(527)-N(7))-methyltransferase RsmG [Bacteroidia bacterium]MDW8056886.1 16S rRNA (guanine(527)-N(7))-methyltransferase RsmG [Bacteroidia bacterium]